MASICNSRARDLEGAWREFEAALRLNLASFNPLNTVTYILYVGRGSGRQSLEGPAARSAAYYQKARTLCLISSLTYDILGSFCIFPRGNYAKAAELVRAGLCR